MPYEVKQQVENALKPEVIVLMHESMPCQMFAPETVSQRKMSFAYQKIEVIQDLVKSEYADSRINKQPAQEIIRLADEAKEFLI